MRSDQHLNPMTGSAEAVALYDTAVDDLLAYRPVILEHLGSFATDHPDLPMGLAMTAYLNLTSTDARDLEGARAAASALDAVECNDREQMHRAAVAAWLGGDWTGASGILDRLLIRWPTDLLALQVGHQLDFFLGDAANLRDRVGRSLDALDAADPHRGFVLGMHSFGLEESGHYEASEAAGLAALAVNPDDVWATHAVTHGYEMQGVVDRGIEFMNGTEANWGSGNLFTVHLWWHLGLFLLEQRRAADVLAIYDREVHHRESMGVPIEMLDASALLWRLHLDGIDTGGRFDPLADAWAASALDQPWYVFNDVHAVMALVGAGRLADARLLVDRLERQQASIPATMTNHAMGSVGLPAAQAVLAFGEGRHADTVDLLIPVRKTLHRFGGSHAQRDAWQRTLIESAMRDGQHDLAAALLRERLSVRPTGEFALSRMSRLSSVADEVGPG
jgi:hypothetical protein